MNWNYARYGLETVRQIIVTGKGPSIAGTVSFETVLSENSKWHKPGQTDVQNLRRCRAVEHA